jgi:hypothetical protein
MTTMLARFGSAVTATSAEVLPPVGERVIVQCEGFRCVGLCDQDGQWVDSYNHHPLPEVHWFKSFGSRR